jgi:hypothetical protein
MTTADRMLFGSAENHASQQSLRGLDWLNLFLAGVLTGFGPFVALYLAGQSWTKVEIGLVLTVSGLTGLLIQIPGGELGGGFFQMSAELVAHRRQQLVLKIRVAA